MAIRSATQPPTLSTDAEPTDGDEEIEGAPARLPWKENELRVQARLRAKDRLAEVLIPVNKGQFSPRPGSAAAANTSPRYRRLLEARERDAQGGRVDLGGQVVGEYGETLPKSPRRVQVWPSKRPPPRPPAQFVHPQDLSAFGSSSPRRKPPRPSTAQAIAHRTFFAYANTVARPCGVLYSRPRTAPSGTRGALRRDGKLPLKSRRRGRRRPRPSRC